MFSGRRLLVVSVLKLTCNLAVPMHKEHKIEKYTIILIMGQQSRSKKSVWAGGEKLKLWPNLSQAVSYNDSHP